MQRWIALKESHCGTTSIGQQRWKAMWDKQGKMGGGSHKFKIKFLLQFPWSKLPVVYIWQAINFCYFILLKNLNGERRFCMWRLELALRLKSGPLCCHLPSIYEPVERVALTTFTKFCTKGCSSLSHKKNHYSWVLLF